MGFCNQFSALARKNWLIWKRGKCGSCCEIFLPILFAYMMIAMRQDGQIQTFPESKPISDGFEKTLVPEATVPNDITMKYCDESKHIVALAPDIPVTQELKKWLQTSASLTEFKFFKNNDEINDYIQNIDYGREGGLIKLCFGVVFSKYENGVYDYTLRYNVSDLGTSMFDVNKLGVDIPDPKHPRIDATLNQGLFRANQETFDMYYRTGVLRVQTFIDNIILKQETDSTSTIGVSVIPMKTPEYTRDQLAVTLQGALGMFLAFPLIVPFCRFTFFLLKEKESKIKESMKIMGLTEMAYWASWLFHYFLYFTLISLLDTLIITTILTDSSFLFIWFWLWIYCMTFFAKAVLISSIFTKAKIGIMVAIGIFFIELVIHDIFYFNKDNFDATFQFWAASMPIIGISFSGDNILALEAAGEGMNFSKMGWEYKRFKVSSMIFWCAVNAVVQFALGIYLELVLPKEYGSSRHCCFCCKKKEKVDSAKLLAAYEEREKNSVANKYTQKVTQQELLEQEKNNDIMIVDSLVKQFPNGVTAVNGTSMKMYKGQIFVLLGHNGAGKTTTLNMLVGLLKPTKGNAYLLNKDIKNNMDALRQEIGLCPQHDILYPDLTLREHLEIFAKFKQMKKEQMEKQIAQLINDLEMKKYENTLISALSGGQCRKVSVALAFIGDPKIIFLDEPSSGLDIGSKRRLWDILKQYKAGRIIIITTHLMNEADFLGDRIAIMGEGTVRTCGTSMYLKEKFGVGYTLNLFKKDENVQNNSEVISFINGIIPTAEHDPNISTELSFRLPLETSPQFPNLFEQLENKQQSFGLVSFGISVTTLEDVFLQVAEKIEAIKGGAREKLNAQKEQGLKVEQENAQQEDISKLSLSEIKVKSAGKLFCMQYKAMFKKRFYHFKRAKKALCMEIFLPLILLVFGCIFGLKLQMFKLSPTLVFSDDFYPTKQNLLVTESAKSLTEQFDLNFFNFISDSSAAKTDFENAIFTKRDVDPARMGSYFMSSAPANNKYDYSAFINTTAQAATAYYINKMDSAILKKATGGSGSISMSVAPFVYTYKEIGQVENMGGVFVFAYVAIGSAFIPALITQFLVMEIECNIKHQQIVSGVSLLAYWLANFTMDIFKYMIFGILGPLIIMAFNVNVLLEGENTMFLWALFISYGFTTVIFSYVMSFAFKESSNAQLITFLIAFLGGYLLGTIFWILRAIPATQNFAKTSAWIFRFFLPAFNFGDALMMMCNKQVITYMEGATELLSVWDWRVAGGSFWFLIIQFWFYLIILIILENIKYVKAISNFSIKKTLVQPKPYVKQDPDVNDEVQRVKNMKAGDAQIKIQSLRKVYPVSGSDGKIAVRNLSLQIQKGECFALLGINGAGKTSTFKMLTGDLNPTSGQIWIGGKKIPEEMQQARMLIGYCPQANAILDNVTAREHLDIFATIKGIDQPLRSRMVEEKITMMGLTKYADKVAGSYSGGNKRKLMVSLAMIGNPPIILLDEPSTGMDPEARHDMWNVIQNISTTNKQSSVIITTHTMDEAEALSRRIAILVEGEMKCIGQKQYLKDKFGQGYEIDLSLVEPTQQQLNDLITQNTSYTSGVGMQKHDSKVCNDHVKEKDVKSVIKQMGGSDAMFDEIKESGYGGAIKLSVCLLLIVMFIFSS